MPVSAVVSAAFERAFCAGPKLVGKFGPPVVPPLLACGFASSGYFIRTFRARHGQTPAVWRQARPSRPAGTTEAAVPALPFVATRERPCRWARLPGDEADDGRPDTAA